MPVWKKNLFVCWFGMFVTGVGMSQIAPVMPLYVKHLGVGSLALVEQFSGIAFGATFVISAIFSPVWGQAADRYGRKPMLLRASLGMAIVIFVMGFARNVYELIALRALQGAITGYSTACITLIATQTDRDHAGWALGTLSTAGVAGSLLGPIIGGSIAENFGLPSVFFVTGALMMVAFITTAFFVQESFTRPEKARLGIRQVWRGVQDKELTVSMFLTSLVVSLALYTVEPIITVYITQLSVSGSHVAVLAGLTFSASGLASIVSAPRLGRLSDRIGAQKVMVAALVVAGVIFIPQAFVKDPWQLMALRFLLGLATGGFSAVNTLLKRMTPESLTGRVFGFNISAMYVGVFAGAVLGGQVAAHFGIRKVFFATAGLLLTNAVWVYFRVYKKLEPLPA